MKDVRVDLNDSAAFQRTVAGLAPEETINLLAECNLEELEEILQIAGDRVRGLDWTYAGVERPRVRLPPGLVALKVFFTHHSEFVFAVSVIRTCPQLQELSLSECFDETTRTLFAALGQSKVTKLSLPCYPGMTLDLLDYLKLNLLEELAVYMQVEHNVAPILEVLRGCTKLKGLMFWNCDLSVDAFAGLPAGVTKLSLRYAVLKRGFNWSALSQVTELEMWVAEGLDGVSMCRALAVRLERAPMERLSLDIPPAVSTLPFHRIRKLEILCALEVGVMDAIAAAIILPGSLLQELTLWTHVDAFGVHMLPALRNPLCSLTKLKLGNSRHTGDEAQRVEDGFYGRLRLLTLIQGQQIRRRQHAQLRRLPVEMLRLVGMTLM